MTTMTPTLTIPKAALRALTELTGDPRPDVALLITLKDAVEHRLGAPAAVVRHRHVSRVPLLRLLGLLILDSVIG